MSDTLTKPSLTIKRRFNAAPAKVFSAWTDPEKMSRWLGPPDVKRVEAGTDLRVGGSYYIRMVMANDEHYSSGVYREIVPFERFVAVSLRIRICAGSSSLSVR